MRMEVEGRGMGGLIRLKSIERIKSQMEGPSTRPAVCLRFRRHPQRISIVFFCFFGSNSSAARLSFFFLFSFSTHPSPASVLWFAMHSCNSLRRHQNGRSFFFSFFFNIYSLAGNGTKDNIRDSDSVAVRSIAIGSAWLNRFRQKRHQKQQQLAHNFSTLLLFWLFSLFCFLVLPPSISVLWTWFLANDANRTAVKKKDVGGSSSNPTTTRP